MGGGAYLLGFAGARLGLAAAKNFASSETRHRRPDSGLAAQFENGAVNVIEIARGVGVNQDGGLAGSGQRLFQVFVQPFVQMLALVLLKLFIRRGVGNCEVVVAALEAAREAFVEHDEFRTIGTGSGILGPVCSNLPREAGVAGEDQDGRAMDAHGRFLALQVGPGAADSLRDGASPVCTGNLFLGSAARFCGGGAGDQRILARRVLERVVDCRPEIDQHAQRLAGRIFGVEHYLPGLADHAQTSDRFLGGELGAAAIDGADTAALEFAQAVLDGVEIVVHEAEKYPPDHEAETGKGHHGRGLEIAGRVLCLELASLLKHTAMQQFAETAATRRRLHDAFERSQPCGELWLLRPEHGLQHLGDIIEVEVGVFEA